MSELNTCCLHSKIDSALGFEGHYRNYAHYKQVHEDVYHGDGDVRVGEVHLRLEVPFQLLRSPPSGHEFSEQEHVVGRQ